MPAPTARHLPLPFAPWRWVRRSAKMAALVGCVAGLGLAGAWEVGGVMLGRNFHAVIPGRVYRCAQPTAAGLEQVVRQHGIRTVVNLRGIGVPWPWYLDECRASHRLDVNHEDVSFSASRLPANQEVRRLIEVLDRTEYPILLHCRQGADRTGLASAVVLLLQTDASLEDARRQLSLRFGHVALDRAAHLDRFFDLYAAWLREHGLTHTPVVFRRWAEEDYCAGECRCRIEPLDVPTRVRRGEPAALRFRFRNTSLGAWRFRPENNAGVHLAFVFKDEADRGVACGRSGLIDARVEPGQGIDLTLVLPAIKRAGRYRLLVDLVDEQHCWFFQVGSEPLEREVEIYD